MSIKMAPSIRRSTKQFYSKLCWLLRLLSSKISAHFLCWSFWFWAIFFQCKPETTFRLQTISVPNKVKHCHHPLFYALCSWLCVTPTVVFEIFQVKLIFELHKFLAILTLLHSSGHSSYLKPNNIVRLLVLQHFSNLEMGKK